ncbi:MAG: hypothetical protein ACOX87_10805 [Chloroflexota bacterium]|jgi:hypothetical protein
MNGMRFPTIGVLIGSAMIAGIITYIVSTRQHRPKSVVDKAREIGSAEATRLSREFVSEKVVPEIKPVLLDLVKEAENYVDRYFERAEKAIKSM